MIDMDYEKLEQLIDSGTCPKCLKQRLNVEEEGGSHTSMVCNNCDTEIYISYEQVVRSVEMMVQSENPDEDPTEILLYEKSE